MNEPETLLQSLSASLGLPSLATFTASQFKNALAELTDMNTTLAEIGKTANLTDAQLEQLGDTSFEVATKLGTVANDYLNNVTQMTNAGYKNAAQMAELMTLVQSANDFQSDLAESYILAADNAFHYGGNVEKLTAFLDGQNKIARENTLNMEELANATITTSTLLSDLPSVKENELAALLGTGLATTQESGETVALAIKEIFENLSAMNTVQTPTESLKELAEVYNSLPDDSTKKADILSDIAGSDYSNILDGILSNWSRYESMLTDYENSSGSLMNDATTSANTLQSTLNSLASTWTDTVGNIADSEGLTATVQALNTLLGGVNEVTEAIGGLGTLGAIGGGILGAKGLGQHVILITTAV